MASRRWQMLFFAACLVLPVSACASTFQLGVWADDTRTSGCVEVPPGGTFTLHGWCFVSDELGLGYATYRFLFPANIEPVGPPSLPREVVDLIVTDFADGTREWNVVVSGCPPDWVKVFAQEFRVLDDRPAFIDIVEDRCWLRDCTFVLNKVTVVGEVGVNDPECGGVPVEAASWGAAKTAFR